MTDGDIELTSKTVFFFDLGLKFNLSVKIDVDFTVFWTGCRDLV